MIIFVKSRTIFSLTPLTKWDPANLFATSFTTSWDEKIRITLMIEVKNLNFCHNYRVFKTIDDVGDSQHHSTGVTGETRTLSQLSIRHVGKKSKILSWNSLESKVTVVSETRLWSPGKVWRISWKCWSHVSLCLPVLSCSNFSWSTIFLQG